jgi:tripeptide aminopeptidase
MAFHLFASSNLLKMIRGYSFTAADRFMRYVQTDTQSDPRSNTQPTTAKQKDLGKILADELQVMGVTDAHMDEYGYVYATIPSIDR